MGPSAEQIIAGVVLSERLAVTMYGAVHRAQLLGQRNLRGLIVDPKMLAEHGFRVALTDTRGIATAIELAHPSIVPTAAVESEGPDVVVVTRGVGRFVTVQDLLSDARVRPGQAGKLPSPVAALICKSVVEAVAAAHAVGVVHGAVHPRSVLVDESGAVLVNDFVVGRALTSAVAAGADSSLWRGLAGFLAPELVVGEDPTPAADVFAIGAMMFQMLSGEIPPGSLNISPAVERMVQRALDTDLGRRYKNAAELLENLVEAFEDDHWELASRGDLIKFAGLARTDTNLDDATEDLLASLGGAVQAPTRPSMDLRAERAAERQAKKPKTDGRLDALLADLHEGHEGEEPQELTAVEDIAFLRRDPVSELISLDPNKAHMLRNAGTFDGRDSRPLSDDNADTLDGRDLFAPSPTPLPGLPRGRGASRHDIHDDHDHDEPTPIPPPQRDSEEHLPRPRSRDEAAALSVISELGLDLPDGQAPLPTAPRARSVVGDGPADPMMAAIVASEAAAAAESAAQRAEAAVARLHSEAGTSLDDDDDAPRPAPKRQTSPRAALPRPELAPDLANLANLAEPPRLRSRAVGVIAIGALIAGGIGFYLIYQKQEATTAAAEQRDLDKQKQADELSKKLTDALPDPGTISISASPPEAGIWLRLGRTPFDSIPLGSDMLHQVRVELDGYQAVDTEVVAGNWTGSGATRKAAIAVALKPVAAEAKDPRTGKLAVTSLPPVPPEPPPASGFSAGRGPIHIESTPPGAEVWMFLSQTSVSLSGIPAGRGYDLRVLATGYLPGYVSISPDDWRVKPGNEPIDVAKKLASIERSVTLQADPAAAKDGKKPGAPTRNR